MTSQPSPLADWEYLDASQNTWSRFCDNAASTSLESAFVTGSAPTATINLNGENLTVDFEKMMHKGPGDRVIKFRRITNKTTCDVTYERKDDHGWVAYDCCTCEMMALAENAGRTTITTFIGGNGSQLIEYHIDFLKKRQMNVWTGFKRNIRIRVSPSAAAGATAQLTSALAQPPPITGCSTTVFGLPTAASRGGGGVGADPGDSGSDISGFRLQPTSGTVTAGEVSGCARGSSSDVETVLAEAEIVECEEDCCICLSPFDSSTREDAALRLNHCPGHPFHGACIRQHFQSKGSCPVCKYPYIVTIGNMPDGTMSWQAFPSGRESLSGLRDVGTIVISYHIPSGVQGPQHPHPGVRFSGASRTAYLPDNSEGREVLRLLEICFQRRLTFTVGQSLTTGQDNVVVWNAVHHKTSRSGGTSSFGWPDETYFARVKDELKAKGIL